MPGPESTLVVRRFPGLQTDQSWGSQIEIPGSVHGFAQHCFKKAGAAALQGLKPQRFSGDFPSAFTSKSAERAGQSFCHSPTAPWGLYPKPSPGFWPLFSGFAPRFPSTSFLPCCLDGMDGFVVRCIDLRPPPALPPYPRGSQWLHAPKQGPPDVFAGPLSGVGWAACWHLSIHTDGC